MDTVDHWVNVELQDKTENFSAATGSIIPLWSVDRHTTDVYLDVEGS